MMSSQKSYGKVNEFDQLKLDSLRKTRKRIAIIGLSTFLLAIIIVSAVVGTWQSREDKSRSDRGDSNSISSSIKAVCEVTLYPDSCRTSLSPLLNSSNVQPKDLFKMAVQVAMIEVASVVKYFETNGVLKQNVTNETELALITNCAELLDLAFDHLNNSLSSLDDIDDLRTWLSSAVTYQETCIDGFENTTSLVANYLRNSTEFTSNSLAIVSEISKLMKPMNPRRLLSDDQMPVWLSHGDRRLLQSKNITTEKIKADIVVAQDGSGKFKKIQDALNAVPDKSKKRFVIYVKKGIYYENVRVEKPKWNVTMIGDGMDATVVSGRLNVIDGTPTFSTATFAVFGQGFIARDMGFRNTAGPAKHQAVALMSSADMTAFHRCKIDAYQDSLYVHANRQFYRECNIYGTVDFIFGNSAVVIQNCNILPRLPMPGQQNTITAQGRVDPNQNTGIVIQNCTIWPYGNLSNTKTYLGRPWKNYSTTVFMQNMIGNLVDPKGWLPWVGTSAPDTIFYAEFQNFGPGSSTKNRVKWKGLRFIDSKLATKFTVKPFISGDKWVKDAGITYKAGL